MPLSPQEQQILNNEFQKMGARIAYLERHCKDLAQSNAELQRMSGEMSALSRVLERVESVRSGGGGSPGGGPGNALMQNIFAKQWGGGGYVSLSDIKGTLIPFDHYVDIPIAHNDAEAQQGVIKVTIDGPFVATHRYAALRSLTTFEVTYSNGTTASFKGRTNGRWRPIHSVTDIMDAVNAFKQPSQYQPSYVGAVYDSATPAFVPIPNPMGINPSSDATSLVHALPNFPGTAFPLVVSPLSMSSQRSMVFDGTIAVEPQGSNFRRQNQPIPSSAWSEGFNKPAELSVYDVWEPGEEVLVKVYPSHVLNPAYGNIESLVAREDDFTYDPVTGVAANNPLPEGSWPFLESQWDGHEGISDPTIAGDSDVTVDRVTRTFSSILTIGYRGFRILGVPSMPR